MSSSTNNNKKWLLAAICLAIGVVIWFLQPEIPEFIVNNHLGQIDPELTGTYYADAVEAANNAAITQWDNGWRLFSIFIATIVALILQPWPMGTVSFIAITIVVLTNTRTMGEALSGFSDATIWLIVCAFFISRGFIKTGLGPRIAYLMMSKFGHKTLTLGYSLTFANLIMGPAMPSNTARCGGIISPIVKSLSNLYDSKVEDGTERRIGSFLAYTTFQADIIVCAMFMTAMAANPMIVDLAYTAIGVELTWGAWFMAALVPGLVGIAVIPYVIYKIYPPEIKETPQAPALAREKLKEMGALSRDEKWMLVVFVQLLVMWIVGPELANGWASWVPISFNIGATATAFTGLSVLLMADVLNFEDIKAEKGAWDTLVWFAALVMMANHLNTLGVIGWFSNSVETLVSGWGWIAAFLVIALAYFYSHYFFASATAHVSAMYAAMLVAAVAVDTPPLLAALVLAYFSNLFMGITHYGTGNAPPWFGLGYVTLKDWWGKAFILSVINIFIWVVIGGAWWLVLGHWSL